MRWVFIDTSRLGMIRVGLLDGETNRMWERKGRNITLSFFASRISLTVLRRIDGVCVVSGPGPFSGLRSGILVANLLARWFRVPLIGIPAADGEDVRALSDRLRAGGYSPVAYVAPEYGMEPNITVPKKNP